MKAMLLREAKPIEERPLTLTELPLPAPGPGEVRLAVRACGVCRTDLHTVEGDLSLPKLPVVPGHQ
ncbi:MAG TPA: alcohol dehydrogenase, partial [Chloroflexi bacterium]|nr:alcohol dehydrogenase [Chloroflexota bacterium]